MKMKLNKLIPMLGVLLSLCATSAFAVGRDSAENSGRNACALNTAQQPKGTMTVASADTAGAGNTDSGKEQGKTAGSGQ
jgi:hypothetical protein